MAGTIKIHPLVKTYDEMRRATLRLSDFKKVNAEFMPKDLYNDIEMMLEKIDEIIQLIPAEHRLDNKEVRKIMKKKEV